jgi:hypothetical protein
MDKIKQQANTVSQLVFSPDTGQAYKKTLLLTWTILRETGILIWLVLCLVFVGGEWFYRSSVRLGRNARTWYNNLGETEGKSEAEAATSTGEALLTSVQSGTAYLLSRARQQLGIPDPEPTPQAPTPAPPKPSTAATTPSAVAQPAATTVTPPVETDAVEDDSDTDEG